MKLPPLALCILLLATSNARAYTCSVSVPGLNFGNYDVFSTTALTSATTLSIKCSRVKGEAPDVGYTVSLSTGFSNSFVQRMLRNGTQSLAYNLYQDSQNTVVWGDGNGGSSMLSGTLTFKGNGRSQTDNVTIYGALPAQQDASVGNYADQITVTLNY